MSKIAISCESPSLDAPIDPRFGRAAGFLLVDSDTLSFEYLDNGSAQVMAQGAGIQAAEQLVRAGAQALLTGYVGPKAYQALTAAGIRIGQNLSGMTVRQALERMKTGEVQLDQPPSGGARRGAAYGTAAQGAASPQRVMNPKRRGGGAGGGCQRRSGGGRWA